MDVTDQVMKSVAEWVIWMIHSKSVDCEYTIE